MCLEGSYYYDKALPFGLTSDQFLYNQLSKALECILLNQCSISFVFHILDDFPFIEPASLHLQQAKDVDRVCPACYLHLKVPLRRIILKGPVLP